MSSLVVDTNLSALNALNVLNQTDAAQSQAISELSSGLKIQSAATGPAQYVIAQSLEAQANGYTQAISNAQNGVSLIQTASGALTQISSILQTMDQLALTSATNATQTSTSRAADQAEFTDLAKTITKIATTTSFGKSKLLTGSFSGTLQIGAFDTSSTQISLAISGMKLATLKLTASKITSASTARAAISAVQSAISTVDSTAAKVGATQNELNAIVANLTVGQQNLAAANSQLVDVNMAQEMTAFTTDQILMQSGVAMLGQAQQTPSLVLKLLS